MPMERPMEVMVATEAILLARCQERTGDIPVTPETDLLEGGLLDSILVMDLVSSVEKQFAVTIGCGDISPRNFRSIRALAALVESRRAA
jgi:acyl carrier protein